MEHEKELKDLIEISHQPTASVRMLLEAAFIRGMIEGKNIAKRRIIEAIEQEK